jgi:hypothetical protein
MTRPKKKRDHVFHPDADELTDALGQALRADAPEPPPDAGQAASYRRLLRWLFSEPPKPQEDEANDEQSEETEQ